MIWKLVVPHSWTFLFTCVNCNSLGLLDAGSISPCLLSSPTSLLEYESPGGMFYQSRQLASPSPCDDAHCIYTGFTACEYHYSIPQKQIYYWVMVSHLIINLRLKHVHCSQECCLIFCNFHFFLSWLFWLVSCCSSTWSSVWTPQTLRGMTCVFDELHSKRLQTC